VTYDLRARPIVLLLLLVVLAAAAGLFALDRARRSSDDSKPVTAAQAKAEAAKASATRRAAAARAKAEARTKAAAARARAKAVQANSLPPAVRSALSADEVVVVALYDPKAKIDPTAMREARAGAERAGTPFVAVDVRKQSVAALNARYGVVHDPAVLVLRQPGSLVVRLDGFADRDTVAQAAVDAASS